MSNYFRKSRNVQKSLKKYLSDCFSADWSGITVLLNFKDAYSNSNSLPIVVLDMIDKEEYRLELGSSTMMEKFGIDINIFGKSSGQTWDLADYISSKVKEGFEYYTYANDPTDKSSLIETDSETRVQFLNFVSNRPIDIGDNAHKRDKFRHKITMILEKNL